MESESKKSHPIIRNIYYMLAYVFDILNTRNFKKIGIESFDNSLELSTAILIQGIKNLLKQGLIQEYQRKDGVLSSPRGKINITSSIKRNSNLKKELYCSYDEFIPNNRINQIIRSTILLLLKTEIPGRQKKELKRFLPYFISVNTVNLKKINWNQKDRYHNKTVDLILFICMLIVQGLIQSENNKVKVLDFIAEPIMAKLYERFILSYYKKEYPSLSVNASRIPWQLDNGEDYLLPIMRSDIMVSFNNTVLIIDAKYYARTLQTYFDKKSIHSGNLYQIFTYVKNKEAELNNTTHTISGMLLYARTDEEIQPDQTYQMSGNEISVKTLDLNCEFDEIKSQLNQIIENHFDLEI